VPQVRATARAQQQIAALNRRDRPQLDAFVIDVGRHGCRALASLGRLSPMDEDQDTELQELIRQLRAVLAELPEAIEPVMWRFADQALLDDPDLQESLAQVRRGEGIVVRPLPPSDGFTDPAAG
jgi:hypothetical protein